MDKVNQTNVIGHGTKHFVWERNDQDFVNNSRLIKFSMIARKDDKNNSFGTGGYMKVTVSSKLLRNLDNLNHDSKLTRCH